MQIQWTLNNFIMLCIRIMQTPFTKKSKIRLNRHFLGNVTDISGGNGSQSC